LEIVEDALAKSVGALGFSRLQLRWIWNVRWILIVGTHRTYLGLPFRQPLWLIAALVKRVSCAWLSNGALEVWSSQLRLW